MDESLLYRFSRYHVHDGKHEISTKIFHSYNYLSYYCDKLMKWD